MTTLDKLKKFNDQLADHEFKAKWVRIIFTNNETRMLKNLTQESDSRISSNMIPKFLRNLI